VPAGLLADRHITHPGAIALYTALTALAARTKNSDETYGTSIQITNPLLQAAARFSGPAQVRRYRNELTDANVIKVARNPSKPPTYELTLNEGANAQLKLETANLTH
jgi:hypothetical protein